MRYALFSGCVIPAKYPNLESATRAVAGVLGLELVDLAFSCCPAPTLIKLVHHESWLAMAARNLAVAEEAGLPILSLCNGCTNTLKEVNLLMKRDPDLRKRVNKILEPRGRQFQGTTEVKPLLDVLCDDVGVEAIRKKRGARTFSFRIACHYGCHFFRPPRIMYPDRLSPSLSLVPTQMDRVLAAVDMTTIQYSRRLLCCGSALGTKVDLEAANEITREKLNHMAEEAIQVIAVGCPSCFEQFDRAQPLLNRKHGLSFNMPVLHISQLLGLAFGIDRDKLGFDQHRVKVEPLLDASA
jgi:heterodisulfide reductase subunit B